MQGAAEHIPLFHAPGPLLVGEHPEGPQHPPAQPLAGVPGQLPFPFFHLFRMLGSGILRPVEGRPLGAQHSDLPGGHPLQRRLCVGEKRALRPFQRPGEEGRVAAQRLLPPGPGQSLSLPPGLQGLLGGEQAEKPPVPQSHPLCPG